MTRGVLEVEAEGQIKVSAPRGAFLLCYPQGREDGKEALGSFHNSHSRMKTHSCSTTFVHCSSRVLEAKVSLSVIQFPATGLGGGAH